MCIMYIVGLREYSDTLLGGEGDGAGFWGAITDRVLARPIALATLTTAALVALAISMLSLNPNPPMDRDGRREDSGRG